uniref:Translation elongation factor P/YeiP central domain-containing protein n=1 Tax=Chromera velia CCMP2878 TaxID=1169474 RepID=A0A0G4HYJ4_9ALVE|mmetsp:Transcript_55272/g.108119  ORF Transcript_55272/g.108119 Transcript_55272/m.108119 type:complete len:227 (+) Transcript_55272:45-725(+)|eukprot:Cvel_1528.t1-p1 / transcript=Cvel_1528.t1 / gene=Cvel_1528 / organism=Chromera_velia_CCMP2878 / gene_product=Elongation factor P, putative / transcript_product=Elongation factor P, putative / location=Cvel_scaffold54:25890-28374(-) / protein_length=226 / sequence_SO=supercontig / SO=protein_coding / is_pseudo=false
MRSLVLSLAAAGFADAFAPAGLRGLPSRLEAPSPSTALSVQTSDFKTGLTIEYDGKPCRIMSFQHCKQARGSAFTRTSMKNLLTGGTVENTFRSGENIDEAYIEQMEMMYLYDNGEEYVFQNTESWEEEGVPKEVLKENAVYLTDGSIMNVAKWNEKIIDVMIPNHLPMEVESVDDAPEGRATPGKKAAYMSTGLKVMVPPYIEQGEVILVDTKTGEFLKRAEKKD